jgi:hypothetical protein
MDPLSVLLFTVSIPFLTGALLLYLSYRVKAINHIQAPSIVLQLGLWVAYLAHVGLQNFFNESLFWLLFLSSIISLLLLIKAMTQWIDLLYVALIPMLATLLMLKPYQGLWSDGWILAIQKHWILDACFIFAFFFLYLKQQASSIAEFLETEYDLLPSLMALLSLGFLTSSIGIVLCGSLSIGQLTAAFGLVFAGFGISALGFKQYIQVNKSQSLMLLQHGYFLLFGILIYAHFYLTPELPKSFAILFLSMVILSLVSFKLYLKRQTSSSGIEVKIRLNFKKILVLLSIGLLLMLLMIGFIFKAEAERTSLDVQKNGGIEYQY